MKRFNKIRTMSEWTDLNEIMRDLSLAQGHMVPASLQTFGTKPPTIKIEEETEAEYYKGSGDADFTKPPDYHLIQKMLTMVTNEQENEGEVNSQLNPLSQEFIPNETASIKRRRENNVAMTSILAAQEQTLAANRTLTSPIGMFRKKQTPVKGKEKETMSLVKLSRHTKCNGEYKPSTLANEYYNKYLTNAKFKEQIKEDIWTKIEREMKEIDEKKRQNEESSCSSSQELYGDVSNSSDTSVAGESGMAYVTLPAHRHVLLDGDDCVVCNIVAKHGCNSFKEQLDTEPFKLL